MTSFLELPGRIWDLAVIVSSRVEPVLMTGHTAGLLVPLNHIALCRCRGCCSSPPSSPTSLWHTTLNAAISSVIKPLSLVKGIPLWLWADLSAADGRSHEGESFMSNHTKPWFITMKQHPGLSNSTRTYPEVSQIGVVACVLYCYWLATESPQRAQSKQDTSNTLGNAPQNHFVVVIVDLLWY